MRHPERLRVAYTPDSDDAFTYYAWEHGRVSLRHPAPDVEFHREHISELNATAAEERFDVVAVSSVAYPRLADRYRILASGNSVGRGWGPVLVSRRFATVAELRGRRVAVAGHPTTGSFLAANYCPGAELLPMPYDRIADAIVAGEVDAGVMIHEELLHFPERGLSCVKDLGKAWTDDTGLPLPVGLNLVRRALGDALSASIASACAESLRWGLRHPDEAFAFASRFGRGKARRHVEMFCSEDTLRLPSDVRRALRVLFDRVAGAGLGPRLANVDIVEGDATSGALDALAAPGALDPASSVPREGNP